MKDRSKMTELEKYNIMFDNDTYIDNEKCVFSLHIPGIETMANIIKGIEDLDKDILKMVQANYEKVNHFMSGNFILYKAHIQNQRYQ